MAPDRRSDLIVLDLGLPDAAGMETLVAARELAGDRPIIVLTGSEDEDIKQRAVLAGADAFIAKRRAQPGALRRVLTDAVADRPERDTAKTSPPARARATLFRNRSALVDGVARAQERSSLEDFWIDPATDR